MSILPLSENVKAQIKSTVEVTSLYDVVEGLFKNSLDASATSVIIEVDFAKGFCSVKDDGFGISAQEFSIAGNLAKRYCTSKHDDEFYGQHGRFLSCLSPLSVVSISSIRRHEAKASTLVLRNQEVVLRQVDTSNEELGRCGTKGVVYNLFGELPVRYKQQSAHFSSALKVEKEFERLKYLLASLLLASGSAVSLSLLSNNPALRYVHKPPRKLEKQRFSLLSIVNVFQYAGVSTTADTWKVASVKSGQMSIRAAISLTPAPSKSCQFVSFGKVSISAVGLGSLVYDEINKAFDLSSFGTINASQNSHSSRPASRKNPEYKQASLRSRLIKGVDRWPRFYIRIDHVSDTVTNGIERDDNSIEKVPSFMTEVLALVRLLIRRFLETSELQPNRSHRPRRKQASRPDPLPSQTGFQDWKRTKDVQQIVRDEWSKGLPFIQPPFPSKDTDDNLIDEDVRILLRDIELNPDVVFEKDTARGQTSDDLHLNDGTVLDWTDPRTGEVHQIDTNNGCIINPLAPEEALGLPNQSPDTMSHRIQRLPKSSFIGEELAQRLNRWPSSTMRAIPETQFASTIHGSLEATVDATLTEQVLEASALSSVTVLRQVDKKFILASVSSATSTSILLIDQHAADERIKVEAFFEEICSGNTTSLTKAMKFEVSNEEATRLGKAQGYFASWAIQFHLERSNFALDPSQPQTVIVTQLPRMIAERCRLEPRLVIEMLRREIWSGKSSWKCDTLEANKSWIQRLAHCPTTLLEMVNSRACRSAIMFSDELTTEQCQALVQRLSKCALPFQCAHGRPSMTMLTTFGNAKTLESDIQNYESFGNAFQRWCN